MFFTHFGILHKLLSILSIDTQGKGKYPLRRAKKKKFCAFGADTFPKNLKLEKHRVENLGAWRGGGLDFEQAAPLLLPLLHFTGGWGGG